MINVTSVIQEELFLFNIATDKKLFRPFIFSLKNGNISFKFKIYCFRENFPREKRNS